MFAASLWSGIEALFGVQQELSFRIALYVAAFVEPRGQGRFELYRHVKKLYGARSKAVHGAKMTDAELREHICDARKVLSRILCAVIDQGRLLTTDEIERLLLVS